MSEFLFLLLKDTRPELRLRALQWCACMLPRAGGEGHASSRPKHTAHRARRAPPLPSLVTMSRLPQSPTFVQRMTSTGVPALGKLLEPESPVKLDAAVALGASHACCSPRVGARFAYL